MIDELIARADHCAHEWHERGASKEYARMRLCGLCGTVEIVAYRYAERIDVTIHIEKPNA